MPEDLLIPVRLASEGYGTPQEIADMRADLVMAAVEFSQFQSTYQETFSQLNKAQK